MARRRKTVPMNFKTMAQLDVPQGRQGKHKAIVSKIMSDLGQMNQATALKVPLAELSESKEKVRAALQSRNQEGRTQRRHRDGRELLLRLE